MASSSAQPAADSATHSTGSTVYSGAEAPERHAPLAVHCFVFGLVATMFSGHSDALGLPIGLDRILLPAALALAFFDRRDRWWRLRSAHIAMLALAIWATASYVTIGYNVGTEPLFTILDRVYVPFLLFAFAPYFLGTETRRLLLLRALTVTGLYLAVTTLLEAAGLHALLLPRYIAAHHANASLSADEVMRAGGPFLFGEPNGMTLAMCGFAAVLLASRSRGLERTAALVIGPLAFVACIAAMFRSVWLGLALGIIAVALTRWQWAKWIPVLGIAGVLGLGAGALAFPTFAEDVATRASTSRSLWDRVNTNDAALRIIADKPLTGIGWQQFVHVGGDYVRQGDTEPLTTTDIEVHNVFLSRGAELGIPGLVFFILAVLLGPVAALTRRIREDLTAWQLFLLASFTVWFVASMTSPNPYPLPTFLLWTLAGFVLAAPLASAPLDHGDEVAQADRELQVEH